MIRTGRSGLLATLRVTAGIAGAVSPGPAGGQALDFEFVRTSRVLTVFDNTGIFLQDPRTGNGFVFFPATGPNNYGFGSGIWVGGLRDGEKVVSTAYDPALGSSEFAPGRAQANGFGGGDILCSDDLGELAQWYPEFSHPQSGEPVILSDRDCVVIYNDSNQLLDVQNPIGLEVRQRTMEFDIGLLSRVLFVVWDVVNAGPDPLLEAFFGLTADMDIGDEFRDDRCSAIPDFVPGNTGPPVIKTNIGLCWDDDFFESSFNPNPPGFAAVTILRGPLGPKGRPLGLTSFTITSNPNFPRPQPDPDSDAQQYDLLAGIGTRAPFIDPVATDQRFVAISGPFDLPRHRKQRIIAAHLWANVGRDITSLDVDPTRCFPQGLPCFLPDPEDPALHELIRVQRAAWLCSLQLQRALQPDPVTEFGNLCRQLGGVRRRTP